jgi:general stress protein CsbA
MFDRLVEIDRKLSERQKITFGAAGMGVGLVLIVVLGFAGITSFTVQMVVALLGVLTMVAGTLMLGTSEQGEQTV